MRWPPPPDWPHREFSRKVYCRPHRWHVQEMGAGDTLLLLHGAGGSTHSFRDLMPLLAERYHVVAVDLPGQGFTQLGARHRSGLEATAADIAALCVQEGWTLRAIVGHSAGGALALRLSQVLGQRSDGLRVVGINAALDTFKGLAGVLFPALAKVLAALPFTAQVFSASALAPGRIEALVSATGSEIDPVGVACYRRLASDRDHVDAALAMMAQWSLEELLSDLPRIDAQTMLIVGDRDRTVPPSVSVNAAARMTCAEVLHLAKFGHLVHEEAPDIVCDMIEAFLARREEDLTVVKATGDKGRT